MFEIIPLACYLTVGGFFDTLKMHFFLKCIFYLLFAFFSSRIRLVEKWRWELGTQNNDLYR